MEKIKYEQIIELLLYNFAKNYSEIVARGKINTPRDCILFFNQNKHPYIGKKYLALLPFIVTMASSDREYFLEIFSFKKVNYFFDEKINEIISLQKILYETENIMLFQDSLLLKKLDFLTTLKSEQEKLFSQKVNEAFLHIRNNHSRDFFTKYRISDLLDWHTYNNLAAKVFYNSNILKKHLLGSKHGVLYTPK